MKNLYVVSYDNFYNSNHIVSIDNIDNYIKEQLKKEESGEFSSLFSCNCYWEYSSYQLEKLSNGDYELILHFTENDLIDTFTITLVKCEQYI